MALAWLVAAGAASAQAGPWQTLWVAHGGPERKVLLHRPPAADPTAPLPLLLAFHGGGGHAEFMADDARYGLASAAARHGFVLAVPNGSSRLPGGRLATWNAGGCCGHARDQGVDDVGFARAVVAAVQARSAVDPARVFATGMSNGGMLVHRLACEAADVFRGVAAVAGTDASSATAACRPARPVAVLHIHARDDTHVQYGGGAGPDAFADRRQVMGFTSVPETMARWAARLRCEPAPRTVLQRPGANCQAWSGCAAGAALQLCSTDQGGHSWPGAQQVRRGKAPATQALDANEVMWAFFSTLR